MFNRHLTTNPTKGESSTAHFTVKSVIMLCAVFVDEDKFSNRANTQVADQVLRLIRPSSRFEEKKNTRKKHAFEQIKTQF